MKKLLSLILTLAMVIGVSTATVTASAGEEYSEHVPMFTYYTYNQEKNTSVFTAAVPASSKISNFYGTVMIESMNNKAEVIDDSYIFGFDDINQKYKNEVWFARVKEYIRDFYNFDKVGIGGLFAFNSEGVLDEIAMLNVSLVDIYRAKGITEEWALNAAEIAYDYYCDVFSIPEWEDWEDTGAIAVLYSSGEVIYDIDQIEVIPELCFSGWGYEIYNNREIAYVLYNGELCAGFYSSPIGNRGLAPKYYVASDWFGNDVCVMRKTEDTRFKANDIKVTPTPALNGTFTATPKENKDVYFGEGKCFEITIAYNGVANLDNTNGLAMFNGELVPIFNIEVPGQVPMMVEGEFQAGTMVNNKVEEKIMYSAKPMSWDMIEAYSVLPGDYDMDGAITVRDLVTAQLYVTDFELALKAFCLIGDMEGASTALQYLQMYLCDYITYEDYFMEYQAIFGDCDKEEVEMEYSIIF